MTKQDFLQQVHPTEAQTVILRLIGEGKGNKAIAKELGVSVRTVATHIRLLLLKSPKLGSNPKAIRKALQAIMKGE